MCAWGLLFLVMNWGKLNTIQGLLLLAIGFVVQVISSADILFAQMRIYKVYIILRRALLLDCLSAHLLTLTCLMLHGRWPDARIPGVMLHLFAVLAWASGGVQANPMVSCGIWAGGRNQMTRNQLLLRMVAQMTGTIIAFAVFASYLSFKFPGGGPAVLLFACTHIFTSASLASAVVTFATSFLLIRMHDMSRVPDFKKALGSETKTD